MWPDEKKSSIFVLCIRVCTTQLMSLRRADVLRLSVSSLLKLVDVLPSSFVVSRLSLEHQCIINLTCRELSSANQVIVLV